MASEKAGIIKAGVPLVCGNLVRDAVVVIQARAKELACPTLVLGKDFLVETIRSDDQGRPSIDYRLEGLELNNLAVPLAGPHQADNAAVALTLAWVLNGLGFSVTEEHFRSGLAEAQWPGRAERFAAGSWPPEGSVAKAPLILDGAHNPAGAQALAAMLETLKRRRLHVILGVLADKDSGRVLGPILKPADRNYLTRPVLSRRAAPGLLIAKMFKILGQPTLPTTLHTPLP